MSAASNYAEANILNYILTTNALTSTNARPTAWYVGLFTSATSDTVTTGGTGQGEVSTSGTGYSRQQVNFTVSTDGSGTTGGTSTATLSFPSGGAGATISWGTITHLAVFDAATGGNCLFHGAVTQSKTIDAGDIFQITAGNLTVTLA